MDSTMDKLRIMQVMEAGAAEIRELRRKNEVLAAKVEMIEFFGTVLHAHPAEMRMRGEGEDVAWKLDRMAKELVEEAV